MTMSTVPVMIANGPPAGIDLEDSNENMEVTVPMDTVLTSAFGSLWPDFPRWVGRVVKNGVQKLHFLPSCGEADVCTK